MRLLNAENNCPICKSALKRCYDKRYFECLACGLVIAGPLDTPRETFYPEGYYGEGGVKFTSFFEALRGFFLLERVKLVVNNKTISSGRVLDIGCGNGRFLRALALKGYDIYGIELPGAAFEAARSVPGIHLFSSQALSAVTFDERFFCAVTLWHVLEHLEDPVEIIRESARWIAEGGFLFIEVPHARSWQARLFGIHWLHLDYPRHRFLFTEASLERLLRNAGFIIVKKSHLSFEMGVFGVIQSTLNLFFTPPNYLYNTVMHRNGVSRACVKSVLSVILAVVLFPFAFVFALCESVFRRGAILRYVCSLKENERVS